MEFQLRSAEGLQDFRRLLDLDTRPEPGLLRVGLPCPPAAPPGIPSNPGLKLGDCKSGLPKAPLNPSLA